MSAELRRRALAVLIQALVLAGCSAESIQAMIHEGPVERALSAEVRSTLAAQGPLAAQRTLEERAAELPRTSDWTVARLRRRIGARGTERCRTLAAASGPGSPYLTDLARRYCTHFGAAAPPDVVRRELVSGVDVTVEVEGAAGEVPLRIVGRALEASYWHDSAAVRTMGRLTGSISRFQKQVADTLELYPGEFLPPGAPRPDLYPFTPEWSARQKKMRDAFDVDPTDPHDGTERRDAVPMRQDVVYRVSLELRISLHPEEFISNIVRAWRMPASPPDRAAGASAPRTSTASLSLDAWLDREIPALVEDLTGTLNALWLERFCTGVSSAEQAARCVHGPLAHGRGAAPAFEPRVQAALETLRSALTEDPAPLYACGGAQ